MVRPAQTWPMRPFSRMIRDYGVLAAPLLSVTLSALTIGEWWAWLVATASLLVFAVAIVDGARRVAGHRPLPGLRWASQPRRELSVDDDGLAVWGPARGGAVTVIRWGDLTAIDRRHASYRLATTWAGEVKVSHDAVVANLPAGERRIRLTPFLRDDDWADLLVHIRHHRPDLVPSTAES